jgi:hypothetical protein
VFYECVTQFYEFGRERTNWKYENFYLILHRYFNRQTIYTMEAVLELAEPRVDVKHISLSPSLPRRRAPFRSAEAPTYTEAEKRLAAQHNISLADVRSAIAAFRTIPNYPCDEDGMPIFYTVEESFRGLDKKLYDHFGEPYRIALQQVYAEEGRECPTF